MCPGKATVYCNARGSIQVRSSVVLMLTDSDKNASLMKCGAFVRYSVHDDLVILGVILRKNIICNIHEPVRLVPVRYGYGGGGVKTFEEMEASEMGAMVSRSSELIDVEDWNAPKN